VDQIPNIREIQVEANGLSFAVLECGAGETLCLLLHGFPEHARSWEQQMPVLAALGYRVWAPQQRGYSGTTRPTRVRDYDIERLIEDVAALIDVSGARRVVLVGHDWGAIVAWCFASRRLRPLAALVIMNVPHPVCFARAVRRWEQMRRSWYVLFFQLPWLPEWLLSRRGGELVEQMTLRSSTASEHFPRALLDLFRAQASDRKTAWAMLAWYRAAMRGGMARQLRQGFPVIETPTLLLWGEADAALAKFTTEGTDEFVRDLTIEFLPGVSHWVQQDATEQVNASLVRFLMRSGGSAAQVHEPHFADRMAEKPAAERPEFLNRIGRVEASRSCSRRDLSRADPLGDLCGGHLGRVDHC
jgi:pimeloyl-ACP methyl ester carboxylesterase